MASNDRPGESPRAGERPPAGYHFVCYARADGSDIAGRLIAALAEVRPAVEVWRDNAEILASQIWSETIEYAIRGCETVLFLVTPSSCRHGSGCTPEWHFALKCGKPVIPLLCEPGVEVPYLLGHLQWIDLRENFDAGCERLRENLRQLAAVKEAEPLPAAGGGGGHALVPSRAGSAEIWNSPGRHAVQFINPPPLETPAYFRPVASELSRLAGGIFDPASRMIVVCGRGGAGKTTLVCSVLEELELHQTVSGSPCDIAGIVCLGPATGALRSRDLIDGLIQLLPAPSRSRLAALCADAKLDVAAKMRSLLAEYASRRAVVLLDNFEDVMDPITFDVTDPELDAALRSVLSAARHGVKAVLTTRYTPRAIAMFQPGRVCHVNLDEGLPAKEARAMLRRMDSDGGLGLAGAEDAVLDEACRRTHGNPRAIEQIFGLLAADRDTDLPTLLKSGLPDNLVEVLTGEAFRRLDPAAQAVMQGLAVLTTRAGAVGTVEAVEHLLRPWFQSLDARSVLARLVHMRFATKDKGTGRYLVREADAEYAKSTLPAAPNTPHGLPDPSRPDRLTMTVRAADYLRTVRLPEAQWKTRADVLPQLAEFELRVDGGQPDEASDVLAGIDYDPLMRWGQYHAVAELRQRLGPKLTRPSARRYNFAILGICQGRLGHMQEAVRCHEAALQLARETGHHRAQGVELGNLGNCSLDMGMTGKALEYFTQAMNVHAANGAEQDMGLALSNIGFCLTYLGRLAEAEEHTRRGLEIARRASDTAQVANRLANLARCALDAGRLEEARAVSAEAVATARLCDDVYIRIDVLFQHVCVLLEAGDLPAARVTADEACRCDLAGTDVTAAMIRAVVAARQGEFEKAAKASAETVERADMLLARHAGLHWPLDCKALAMAVAFLTARQGESEAVAAFRAARAVNQDAGVILRVLKLIDALSAAADASAMPRIRAAAEGRSLLER